MLRQIAPVLALTLLAGCGSAQFWTKPIFTDMEFKRDSYECERDSAVYGGGSGVPGAMMVLAAQRQADRLFRLCMEARGWSLVSN